MSVSYATREAIWIKALLQVFYGTKSTPIVINGDNQTAISLARDSILNDRTKPIEVKYHYTRVMVESNEILLQYVPADGMIGDAMTKCLGRLKHHKHVSSMGMHIIRNV